MRNIYLHNISFHGTYNGFYIKSAKTQGRIIEEIILKNPYTPVPIEKGKRLVKNLNIKNITSTYEDDYQGKSIVFYIEAYNDNPIQNITMTDVNINAKEFGSMHHIKM